jgi:hypothetical protein
MMIKQDINPGLVGFFEEAKESGFHGILGNQLIKT